MDDRKERRAATEKPFEEEVKHPDTEGQSPTPDDRGDPKRQEEARKTTQRQE